MTRKLIFTVDLDRDVNVPIKGHVEARSIDRGFGDSPRFSSSEKGLRLITNLLDDIDIKATFFVEGRTAESIDCSYIHGHAIGLHGYDHEDLLGKYTGVKLDAVSITKILEKGMIAVTDRISHPKCFRAPYMAINKIVFSCIRNVGIHIDSSLYSKISNIYTYEPKEPKPQDIMEFPVSKGCDSNGNVIVAYLWPMHEMMRRPSEYVDLASKVDDGLFVLATHAWHMVEGLHMGYMNDRAINTNVHNLRYILENIIDMGFCTSTMC